MATATKISSAQFSIGDLVHHRLFNYRGVIVDVDANFQLSQAWYDTVAKSHPPKDKPWYHVLVHAEQHSTYVAEQNLESDDCADPIKHPQLEQFFIRFEQGHYVRDTPAN